MDAREQNRSGRVFYGWYVLGGLFILGCIAPMGRYILSALFPFMMEDPGWSRQTIGLAFTIHFWFYAVLSILAGKLIDEIGGRVTILCGGVLVFVGLSLLSAVNEIWQFYAVFGVLMATAVSMTHFLPITVLVRKWFIKKAGFATGLVTVGMVVGFAVFPPLISATSARMGWRTACFIFAVGFGALIVLTAAVIIRKTPESMGLRPDGDEATVDRGEARDPGDGTPVMERSVRLKPMDVLKTTNFWYFFIAYAVSGIPMQGALGHVIIWSVELGFSRAKAGTVLAALTIPSVPVRILGGWLGDRFGKRNVLILFNAYTMVVWIFGWVFVHDTWSFLIFIVLLGFGYSAPFSLYTPLLGDVYGRMIVGTLMGVLTLGHGIIGGIGPFLWGWIADATGSYVWNCPVSALCYLVVAGSLFLFQMPGESNPSAGPDR